MTLRKNFTKFKLSLLAVLALFGASTAAVLTPSVAHADANLNSYQCTTTYYSSGKYGNYRVYCYNPYTGASYVYWV